MKTRNVQVTVPNVEGVDLERIQDELRVDGIDLSHFDENPEFFGEQDPRSGAVGTTRPNRHVVIYKRNAGIGGLPADREGLEELIKWHRAELGTLAAQGVIIPPHFSAIVEGGFQITPRLYTVSRALTGPDLYDRITTPPASLRDQTSIRRQRPVVRLAQALLGYYTDDERPHGRPVIAGIGSPADYTLVHDILALKEGSVPIQASPDAPERGVDGELWALGNWVDHELRETPDTLSVLDAIAHVRHRQ